MFNPTKSCFSTLHKWGRSFLSKKSMGRKSKSKSRSLLSGFDVLASSFAGTEVSNQLAQVFKLIDTNNDGKISPFDLTQVLVCLGHDTTTATKEAEGMVREIDFNGDGFIDLDEFMDVLNGDNEGSDCGKEDDSLMDAFLIFDSDKNGFISAKDLQKVLVSLGWENCSLQDCNKMIEGVDRDGDGLVDFDEFRSMMTSCPR
ncbi:EF-hand domain [Dillenia turbinata]|uniref:EF-hand domain n=1 Tax=Dillenia turbinata TaxID=194707 RepID=A0AAN8UZY7_9MAGN